MRIHEKKTFYRFIFIYLTISFLLFFALISYYYFEQKIYIEQNFITQINNVSKEYKKNNYQPPKGFDISIEESTLYESPALIKTKERYISTSCGNLKDTSKIMVIKADTQIIQNQLDQLKIKIFYFMFFLFVINFIISISLARIAIRPVREANEEFKIFIDDLIHDLNAPISAMSINLETLSDSFSEKKIDRISRSLKSIKNIYLNLESILQFEYKYKLEKVELKEFCEDIVFKLQPLFKDAHFHITLPSITIETNRFIFERIIVNLLENSVKYGKTSPKITLGFNENNQFYIQDDGIGISNIDTLFQRSTQSNNKNKGYGLGLSIVKRLSEQLKMKLHVVSEPNQGTMFYFDLTPHIINL